MWQVTVEMTRLDVIKVKDKTMSTQIYTCVAKEEKIIKHTGHIRPLHTPVWTRETSWSLQVYGVKTELLPHYSHDFRLRSS